jgi:hypothetical protein
MWARYHGETFAHIEWQVGNKVEWLLSGKSSGTSAQKISKVTKGRAD